EAGWNQTRSARPSRVTSTSSQRPVRQAPFSQVTGGRKCVRRERLTEIGPLLAANETRSSSPSPSTSPDKQTCPGRHASGPTAPTRNEPPPIEDCASSGVGSET